MLRTLFNIYLSFSTACFIMVIYTEACACTRIKETLNGELDDILNWKFVALTSLAYIPFCFMPIKNIAWFFWLIQPNDAPIFTTAVDNLTVLKTLGILDYDVIYEEEDKDNYGKD